MGKFAKALYTPKNPDKYMGAVDKIIYRSSWELAVMRMLDQHPHVTGWMSEPKIGGHGIPYKNPLTNRHTVYIPDFLVVFQKNGKSVVEMWEVKPAKEVAGYGWTSRLSKKDKLAQAVNWVKWQAAASYCAKRSIFFRVLTEDQIFGTGGKVKKKK